MQVITIGRAATNTVVINETNVSSVHAQITISDNQLVLEDLGSTNGTSVAKVENKINRAAIKLSDTIFLGSISYSVKDIVEQANSKSVLSAAEKASGKPIVENLDKKSPDNKCQLASPDASKPQSLSPTLKAVIGGGCGLVLIFVLWFALKGPESDPVADGSTDNENQTASKSKSNDPKPDSKDLSAEPPIKGKDPSFKDVDTPGKSIALTNAEKLSHSLFLLVCSDPASGTGFRVGTAFAIDNKHLATSASVIAVMEDTQKNGFPDAILYNPMTKQELEIVSTKSHRRYKTANAEARKAQLEHDKMFDELEANPPSPEAFEKVKEKLVSARSKAIESFELQTTCDVAIIEVNQKLEHWLVGEESTSSLRPKLKLNVTGFAIDNEDPFFDNSAVSSSSTMSCRVNHVSNWSSDLLQRLEVSGTDKLLEYSFLGSPAINEQGRVVAICSRTVPAKNETEVSSNGSGEQQIFDAPLFERVRECLGSLK